MVESEAAQLSEEVMLGAVMFGHRELQAVDQRHQRAGRRSRRQARGTGRRRPRTSRWSPRSPPRSATASTAAYAVRDKLERRDAISKLKKEIVESLKPQCESKGWNAADLGKEFGELEYNSMRASVLKTRTRIDGRDLATVRPITVQTGVLPRTHGSALFTRGETQAIVTTTLGTARDGQIIDAVRRRVQGTLPVPLQLPPVLGR